MLKIILLQPNLATNAKVVFKLCSLLITTLTYHTSTLDACVNVTNHTNNAYVNITKLRLTMHYHARMKN